jgi:hypothetical protein
VRKMRRRPLGIEIVWYNDLQKAVDQDIEPNNTLKSDEDISDKF